MKQHLAIALATLTVAAASPAALASSTSSFAELSGLRFQLVDIDLSDGITPYIHFAPSPAVPSDYSSRAALNAGEQFGNPGGPAFTGVSGSVAGTQSQVSASITASGMQAPSTASVSGSSSGPQAYSAVASPIGSLSTPLFPQAPQFVSPFTLSPNTTLLVSAQASGQVSLTQSAAERATWAEAVGSFATLSVRGDDGSFQRSAAGVSVGGSDLGAAGTAQRQYGESLSLNFSNAGALERTGSLVVEAGVLHTVALAPPIPEPGTYALMLTGLLGLAGLRRSRRGR